MVKHNETTGASPFTGLARLFHEPNRLAILSALCASGAEGMTFNELKDECDLTDGNLSRHLKALEDAGITRLEKAFVGVKPRTTVYITGAGWEQFRGYLEALESVLETAARAAASQKKHAAKTRGLKFAAKPARA